ncbi:MAG: 5'/3'-nucleotidase SurE [Pseudomonadota bacterium]
MKILLTNDDGIDAPGFDVLRKIAAELTDSENIWEVAPLTNQSGVGRCVSYMHPMTMMKRGERSFALQGFPADCVLAALGEAMPERPDLILSGVNNGNNSGQNAVYSGTVGAAMEGALQGVKSIALSQYFGPGLWGLDDKFDATLKFAAPLIQQLLEFDVWGDDDYMTFYNINFPPVAPAEVKGTQVVGQGFRNTPFFAKSAEAPNKRTYLYVSSGSQHEKTAPDTDVAANLEGYISITPMTADLTDRSTFDALAARFGND